MRQHQQSEDAALGFLAQEFVVAASDLPRNVARDSHSSQSPLADRIDVALRATRALAFPQSHGESTLQKDSSDEQPNQYELPRAEGALLGETLRVLQCLALPADSAVFLASGPSSWRLLTEAGSQRVGDLQDLQLEAPSAPTVASLSRHAALWRALAPWRVALPEMGHVVLVPIRPDEQTGALFALGFSESSADRSWLSVAGAVATACAAGIEALRLRQRAATASHARDTYISLAAHELRSPITSIKGYSQLLIRQARRSPLPEAMQRSVESIEQQSARMADMVGELLDASRIRQGPLEMLLRPTDLVSVVQKVVEKSKGIHPLHTFLVETETTSLVGMWDAGRIEQVLRDLIDNSASHSPAGGAISIRIGREGTFASVAVRDEGIGVAEEDRERIFEYLYRSSISVQRNLAGLGLGLFVSRHIIERHGGRLFLAATQTTEPSWSEFQFTLPLE